MHPDRDSVDPDNSPVLYRRSTGERRDDIVINPPPAKSVRVVRGIVREPDEIPAPRAAVRDQPNRATTAGHAANAYWNLARRVLRRYVFAALILAAIVWAWTSTAWLALTVGALPLVVFGWYTGLVIRQTRAYRRGNGPPPPGWYGRI